MTIHALSDHPGFAGQHPSPYRLLTPSIFPADAHAVIYRPARSAMTSGNARMHEWKLRFERRTPPFIEPLMGWTGGDDTLTQAELSFPSADSAIAYARRQGLQYTVVGMPRQAPELRVMTEGSKADRSAASRRRLRLEWIEHTLGPDVIREGFGPGDDPSAIYDDPKDILRDSKLSPAEKRDLLHRWARDAYLTELALSRGEPQKHPSHLEDVIDALIKLDQPALRSCDASGGQQAA